VCQIDQIDGSLPRNWGGMSSEKPQATKNLYSAENPEKQILRFAQNDGVQTFVSG
jgi:hypothetical protein